MGNNKKWLWVVLSVVLVAALVVGLVLGLGKGNKNANDLTPGGQLTYTIEVKSATGIPLKDVSLFVYEDSSLQELVAVLKTDEAGSCGFTDLERSTYVAVLEKVPTGYVAQEQYPLTGALTEIVLQTGTMEDADVETLTYKLGDAVMDFSVTGPDGTVYTLSELFKGKKAVVLNFFYNACNPCMQEFPFLQEAYGEYSDSVAVLAMNPYDADDAAVAALQKELGLTFPMVKCDPQWQKIMGITAYPTTVFIDRFGNICLIHVGSVPDAKTFKDAFAYFSAEDYEQKLIESIDDLKVEEPKGTEDNPEEVGGQDSFQVTVAPGQVVYYDLYKAFNRYLQIKSPNAYVIYNGQTHYPKNGVVGLMVSSPDSFTPAKLAIGNSGDKEETFTVYINALKGSFDNPYTLVPGELDVSIPAGNEQGIYYVYTPTEDGTLVLECLSAPAGVKYSYSLYNTVTSAMRNLEEDSVADENGKVTVSVQAKAGQLIQLCFSTLPDSTNSYPGGQFKYLATFQAGQVDIKEEEVLLDYTLAVTDDLGNPVANVSVLVQTETEKLAFATESDGIARMALKPGSYTGEIYVPDGYSAALTQFTLTEAAPNAALTLTTIKKADYTVTVLDPAGAPVEGVLVKLGDGQWITTGADGIARENRDVARYTVVLMAPAGFESQSSYTFEEGKTELTVTLCYPAGSQSNPYLVDTYPYTTEKFSRGKEAWYQVTLGENMVGIIIEDADAYIRCGDVTYGADAQGIVTFRPEGTDPVIVAIGNGGSTRESYTIQPLYAPGSEENPIAVTAYPYTTPTLAAGQSLYFRFTQVEKVLGFTVNDPDITVTYVETVYAPENGVLSYLFPEANTLLALSNNGAQEKTFTLEAILPEIGTEENPEVVTALGNLTRKLEAGDTDGYYYTYTTAKSGTLTVRLLQNVSVAHDVELYTQYRYSLMSESGVTRQVSIDMVAGETVTIHLYVSDPEYPGANFRMRTSFVEGQVLPPETEPPVTEPEETLPSVTEPPATEPEQTQPSEEYRYEVVVTDIFGAGQKNVGVMFLKDGVPVEVVNTDASGMAEHYTDQLESYTVELVFSGKEYYYDKAAAVLTPESRSLTVKLIANVDFRDSQPLYILNDNPAYTLYTGGTRVQLGTGKPNFSAEYEDNCFFVFTPQEAGTYQITVTPSVELSYWGSTFFTEKNTGFMADNAITFSISGSSVGNMTYVLGVKANTSVTDAVVNIARIGDPEFNISDQPWTEWETGIKPNGDWMEKVGLHAAAGEAYYELGKAPNYLDISAATGTYNLVYNEEKGYYQLGNDGPVLLVDLNATGRYVPLYERVNGNGQYGGSSVTCYFFDSTGKFSSKEDYTEYLQACFTEMKLDSISEKGYYPLTKDMMRVLRNGFAAWWDETSPNYLEGFATANKEYAWLFACCYVQ